jgi:hypothetical protein
MATKTPTATATVVEVKGGEEIGKKNASLLVFFAPETVSYFIGAGILIVVCSVVD